MRVVVKPDGIEIDNWVVRETLCLDERSKVLGPPDRTVEPSTPAPMGYRNNQMHMYDGLGLYLNEHHATRRIQDVTFVFNIADTPFRPSAL